MMIILWIILVAAIFMVLMAVIKKPGSVYKDKPEEKNPMEGKKVQFIEDESEDVNGDGVRGHLVAIGNSNHSPSFYEKYVKRCFDVLISFCGLIILSPIFLILSLWIVIDDPGPVIFTQKRIGQNKQYFKLHKFRSMKMTAPHDKPTHMLENPEQYITKAGRFIRAHSLDELPQIWDIFIGNMSVIGPRPGLWNQDLLTAERDKWEANDIKPGLSGLAQINGRDELEISVKAKLDGEYKKQQGIKIDIKCFFRSIGVLGGDKSVMEGSTGKIHNKDERTDELVSIITPSYNTANFIVETIRCVLDQTYTNWEMIIVDDCSADHTDEAVKPFLSDTRIRYLKNEKNSGAAVSRNKALREAKGKWIAFLDSDDLWKPEKLEKQINFMKEHGYHFSYTKYSEIDDMGNSLGTLWTGPQKIGKIRMAMFNHMGCLTVMYDRVHVGIIQVADIRKRNDYAIWVKVVKKCPAYLLDENLAAYRVRGSGSITNRQKNPLGRMKFNYEMWYVSEGKGKVAAGFLTGINTVFGIIKKIRYRKNISRV